MADANKKYLTASDDAITNKYTKPSSGIPASDLAQAVQDQLVWKKGRNATKPGVEMTSCNAIGNRAVAEGAFTVAFGTGSHAEGSSTSGGFIVASGAGSHAEGYENDSTDSGIVASGKGAHAEGCCDGGAQITASGDGAHAEGYCFDDNDLIAEGTGSHAEGCCTRAEGDYSHSEGNGSYAAGVSSHAEGQDTLTEGNYSHTEGIYTITQNDAEHAEGKYNKSNKTTNGTAAQNDAGSTLHSVGIGTSANNRANAFEIMQNGDVYIKGVGRYDGTNAGVNGIWKIAQLISTFVSINNDIIFSATIDESSLMDDIDSSGQPWRDTITDTPVAIFTEYGTYQVFVRVDLNTIEQTYQGLDVIISNLLGYGEITSVASVYIEHGSTYQRDNDHYVCDTYVAIILMWMDGYNYCVPFYYEM